MLDYSLFQHQIEPVIRWLLLFILSDTFFAAPFLKPHYNRLRTYGGLNPTPNYALLWS
jgi:hypothetical protein